MACRLLTCLVEQRLQNILLATSKLHTTPLRRSIKAPESSSEPLGRSESLMCHTEKNIPKLGINMPAAWSEQLMRPPPPPNHIPTSLLQWGVIFHRVQRSIVIHCTIKRAVLFKVSFTNFRTCVFGKIYRVIENSHVPVRTTSVGSGKRFWSPSEHTRALCDAREVCHVTV